MPEENFADPKRDRDFGWRRFNLIYGYALKGLEGIGIGTVPLLLC